MSGGVIEKTEEAYHLVGRQLVKLRKSGDLPFGWIADNTRWQRKPNTYSDLETMLRRISRFYRRQLWDNQDAYVEIWLEKDALSGVLYDVTREFDVPLMVTRGYPSLTFMHSAADKINEINKPTHIYYFGDHDPSGVDIPRKVRQTLEEFDCEFEFECVAVTPDQISSMNLLTRPTKKSDSRSKGFEGESVEVDAIHPDDLRALVARLHHPTHRQTGTDGHARSGEERARDHDVACRPRRKDGRSIATGLPRVRRGASV